MITTRKNHYFWQLYLRGVKAKQLPSLEVMGLTGLRYSNQRGFVGTLDSEQEKEFDVIKGLIASWESQKGIEMLKRKKLSGEQKIVELGIEFVDAAADPKKLDRMKEIHVAGLPINFQHPSHLSTALHRAGGMNNFEAVNWLVSTGECDHLLLDANELMACDRARIRFGWEEELNTVLNVAAFDQAKEQGVDMIQSRKERSHALRKYSDHVYMSRNL